MRELVTARVLGSEPLGAYRVIRLAADGIDAPAPGQFAMARDPRGQAYLPRPVGPFLRDGELVLIVDPAHGVGRLAEARGLALLSPLGRGFDLAGARASTTLLVAGGIGITVFPDVPRLLGGRPRLIAGFRTAEQAAAVTLVDAEAEVVLAPRLVTEPLDEALAAGGVERVLASGSGAMARAVAERCAAAGVACQVALETPMACGFGACYGCAVRLDGAWVRLCVEGPVVHGARLVRG
jgi:NAD(P)H-flavin reductase